MFRYSQLIVVALVLLSLGVILSLLHFNSVKQPTGSEWKSIVIQSALNLIPQGAKNCGVIGLADNSSLVNSCVKNSMEKGESFSAISEARGEDSNVWELLVKTSNGEMRGYIFDSYGWEEKREPRFVFSEVPYQSIELWKKNFIK